MVKSFKPGNLVWDSYYSRLILVLSTEDGTERSDQTFTGLALELQFYESGSLAGHTIARRVWHVRPVRVSSPTPVFGSTREQGI